MLSSDIRLNCKCFVVVVCQLIAPVRLPYIVFNSDSSDDCLNRHWRDSPAPGWSCTPPLVWRGREGSEHSFGSLLGVQSPLPWECCRELPSPLTNRPLVTAGNLACCLGDAAGIESRLGVCVCVCVDASLSLRTAVAQRTNSWLLFLASHRENFRLNGHCD